MGVGAFVIELSQIASFFSLQQLCYLVTKLDHITELNLAFTQMREVSKEHCNGCGMPTDDAYSTGHLVLSLFGTCMCSKVEINLSQTCLVSGLKVLNISVLLFTPINTK